MKAIIQTKYGSADVLQLKEVEKPTPKEDEVLIRIVATPATTADNAKASSHLSQLPRFASGCFLRRDNHKQCLSYHHHSDTCISIDQDRIPFHIASTCR